MKKFLGQLSVVAIFCSLVGYAMAGPSTWTTGRSNGGTSGALPDGGIVTGYGDGGQVAYFSGSGHAFITSDPGFLESPGGLITVGNGATGSLTYNTGAGVDAVQTESGLTKTSAANQTFNFDNPGAGRLDVTVLDRVGVGLTNPGADLDVTKTVNGGAVVSDVVNLGTGVSEFVVSAGTGGTDAEIAMESFNTAIGTAVPGQVRFRGDGAGLTSVRLETSGTAAPIILEYDNSITTREFFYAIDGTTGIIANRSNLDRDFQIRAVTDSNAFYVDASANSVGIGTATPGGKLTVDNGAAATSIQIWKDNGSAVWTMIDGGDVHVEADLNFIPTTDGQGSVGTAANRFKLVRAVTITSGDIGFDDDACPICHKPIEEHDSVMLYAKARVYPDKGKSYIPTVPAHLSCLVVDSLKRAMGVVP